MKCNLKTLFGCLCLTLCSAAVSHAKEWRGIKPLRSTRSDVVRLLGAPKTNQNTGAEFFDLSGEVVTIKWADPTCGRKYPIAETAVINPEDVVLSLEVFPKKAVRLSELHPLPLTANATCLSNVGCMLWDDEEGVAFSTSGGGVKKVSYYSTADEFKDWLREREACVPSRAVLQNSR